MLRVLSLGAGVQSSTLALMIKHGEVPMVDCAIFADTGGEPASVYKWLSFLKDELPFPVHTVSNGNLMEDILQRKGNFNPIPAYHNGSIGRRQCTYQYKLRPLHAKMRELAGLAKGARSDGPVVECLIGISNDEVYRMKPSQDAWRIHQWPLVDLGMTRGHCLEWLAAHQYGKAPRSACSFCPYHSDKEWKDMDFNDFARAVWVDDAIGHFGEHLHRSEKPLSSIEFADTKQVEMFNLECEGMCGV